MTSGQRYQTYTRKLRIATVIIVAFLLSLPLLLVGLNPIEFIPLIALSISGLF